MTEKITQPSAEKRPQREDLFNEIIYQRYLINRERVQDTFERISIPEYIILHNLKEKKQTDLIYGGRIYLSEIAEKMEIPTSRASKMVRELKDRGLVKWSHDGAGEGGTYVEITEEGERLLSGQAELVKDYYGRVIEKFGIGKAVELLKLMKELEMIMTAEYDAMEEEKQRKGCKENPNGGERHE